ncbi:hypothetical protein L1887_16617 [Cichorium endivia]|nr:hypothetical protein L1887_16617 [Cichorium endivia]
MGYLKCVPLYSTLNNVINSDLYEVVVFEAFRSRILLRFITESPFRRALRDRLLVHCHYESSLHWSPSEFEY